VLFSSRQNDSGGWGEGTGALCEPSSIVPEHMHVAQDHGGCAFLMAESAQINKPENDTQVVTQDVDRS
jgi:hypothetical protein